jgi:hypothetical protein
MVRGKNRLGRISIAGMSLAVTGIRKQNRYGPVVTGSYGHNVMVREVGFENTTVRLVLARKLAPVGPVWGSDIAEELSRALIIY